MLEVGTLVEVLDGSNIEDYGPGWVAGMEKYIGNTYKICRVSDSSGWYELEGAPYWWDGRGLLKYEDVAIPELGDVMDLMF